MPLALILPSGDQWYLLRKPQIRLDKGDTLSLLVQFLLKPWVPCAPPPASLLLSGLFGLAATEPTLSFLHFSLFPPKSAPFSTWRLQLCCSFLCFFASRPPSPIISATVLASVPVPVPVPIRCSSTGLHLRPRSRPPSYCKKCVVCVCVCCHHIYFGRQTCGRTSRVHTGSLHPSSAVLALIFLARRTQPFLSLVDREVEFCVPTN